MPHNQIRRWFCAKGKVDDDNDLLDEVSKPTMMLFIDHGFRFLNGTTAPLVKMRIVLIVGFLRLCITEETTAVRMPSSDTASRLAFGLVLTKNNALGDNGPI